MRQVEESGHSLVRVNRDYSDTTISQSTVESRPDKSHFAIPNGSGKATGFGREFSARERLNSPLGGSRRSRHEFGVEVERQWYRIKSATRFPEYVSASRSVRLRPSVRFTSILALYQQPFSHPSTSSSGSGVCDPFATVASDDFSNLVLAYHFEGFTIIKQ